MNENEVIEAIAERVAQRLLDALPEAIRRGRLGTYLNDEQAQAETGLTKRHLHYLRENRLIPYRRVGRSVLYETSELFAYIDARGAGGPTKPQPTGETGQHIAPPVADERTVEEWYFEEGHRLFDDLYAHGDSGIRGAVSRAESHVIASWRSQPLSRFKEEVRAGRIRALRNVGEGVQAVLEHVLWPGESALLENRRGTGRPDYKRAVRRGWLRSEAGRRRVKKGASG